MATHSLEFDRIDVIVRESRHQYPIGQKMIIDFLNGPSFADIVKQMLRRGITYEQGIMLASGPDCHIRAVWDKEVGFDYAQPSYNELERNHLIPIMAIHIHPLRERLGAYRDYVPSEQDLLIPQLQWEVQNGDYIPIKTAGGLIVPGRKPRIWIWQTPNLSEVTLEHIYESWNIAREHANVTYHDITTLEGDLRNFGVNIHTAEVDRADDIGRKFSTLIESNGIQFGF
jgi:hypothetical protein